MSIKKLLGLDNRNARDERSSRAASLLAPQLQGGEDPLVTIRSIVYGLPEARRAQFLENTLGPLLAQKVQELAAVDFDAEIRARQAFVRSWVDELYFDYRANLLVDLAPKAYRALERIFEIYDQSKLRGDHFREFIAKTVVLGFIADLLAALPQPGLDDNQELFEHIEDIAGLDI